MRFCLAVMASTREEDTIFNNCCQKAAGRVLAGETGMMALGEIMREVAAVLVRFDGLKLCLGGVDNIMSNMMWTMEPIKRRKLETAKFSSNFPNVL